MGKKEFIELAEGVGIDVTYTPAARHPRTREVIPYSITLDAPRGFVFVSSSTHTDASIQGEIGSMKTDWGRAQAALEGIIALGFDRCDDPDCDICGS